MRRIAVLGAPFFLLIPTHAAAQAPQASPEALVRLYACAETTDPTARLACYDEAVGRLRTAETEGQIVAVDRQQAQTIRREAFGFNMPTLSQMLPNFRGGGETDALGSVEVTVSRITEHRDGTHSFVMDNGQVWTQVEPQDTRNVRPGDLVTIRTAALGSYRLISSRGGSGHRVRREN